MKISLTQARFLKSTSSLRDFPKDSGAEIAFCGRSNAGKSSALNAICRQKHLARTSKTPGRTQLINFFAIDGDTRLVDLPGYGFAKAPAKIQQNWQKLMESYLHSREALYGLVLLMDIRHPLTEIDWAMIRRSQHYQLPLYILLTKVDKVNRNDSIKTLTKVTSTLEQESINFGIQLFSAPKNVGISQAQEKVSAWLTQAVIQDH